MRKNIGLIDTGLINRKLNRSLPKFPGVPFLLNGERLLIPSLTLAQFEENYDLLVSTQAQVSENLLAYYAKYLAVIGAAIRTNYPEITDAYLKEWIHLYEFASLLKIVQAASGMEEVKPGE